MLKLRFDPRVGVEVDPPYDQVGGYLLSEMHYDPPRARAQAAKLRAVMAGATPLSEDGNAYLLEAGPETSRITFFIADDEPSSELPTAWLVDALEQWAAHLDKSARG